ncbi:integrase catalytic domain-containing protein [Trichonephila clavipes]|nr:integrase catalytic domain-containing protein [Trichonephila clavipes]
MQEYEQLGHMTKVKEDIEPSTTYYIPHHSFYRPEKSSAKLRVVFNASCPTPNGRSLNFLQAIGGIIQDEFFSIIIRFRKQPISMTAVNENMYRITASQRDHLRTLWKSETNDPVSTYRINTVTYGTTKSSFLIH